jgi:hypothetical protein
MSLIDYSKIFKPGDKVKVSDGKPMPPLHHKKKLATWKCDNYIGTVYSASVGEINIDALGKGIIIRRYDQAYSSHLIFEPVEIA